MLSVSGDVILSEFDDTLDGTDDELLDEDDGISSLGSLSSTGTQNNIPGMFPLFCSNLIWHFL